MIVKIALHFGNIPPIWPLPMAKNKTNIIMNLKLIYNKAIKGFYTYSFPLGSYTYKYAKSFIVLTNRCEILLYQGRIFINIRCLPNYRIRHFCECIIYFSKITMFLVCLGPLKYQLWKTTCSNEKKVITFHNHVAISSK